MFSQVHTVELTFLHCHLQVSVGSSHWCMQFTWLRPDVLMHVKHRWICSCITIAEISTTPDAVAPLPEPGHAKLLCVILN